MKINIRIIFFSSIVGLFLNSSWANADTLKDAIMQTLKTNPDVLYSIKGWLASEQGVDKAKGGYFPKLDVNADIGPQHSKNVNNNFDYATLNTTGGGISLRQLVFDGFATQSNVDSNKNHTLAQTYQVLATANDTALLATKAYLDVITNQKIVTYAGENYATMQSIADTAQHKGNKADISLAQGRVAQAKADLLSAQNNYSDAQTIYYKIIGSAPQNLVMPTEPTDKFLPENKNTTVKNAVNNNPALKSSEASINEARSQYKGAKSNFYPHVDAVLEARADDNLYGVNGTQANEQALLELSYNLFNGGSDQANEKQAGYLVEQSQKTRDLVYTQVVEKARVSWDELDTSKGKISYLKQHSDSAGMSANAYYQEYKKGKRSLVDLLNTEEELFHSRVDYVTGQSNVLFSKYWVLNSEGYLLSYFQIPTSVSNEYVSVEAPKVQSTFIEKQPVTGITATAPVAVTTYPVTKTAAPVVAPVSTTATQSIQKPVSVTPTQQQPIQTTVQQPINLSPQQQPAAVTMQSQVAQQPPVKVTTATNFPATTVTQTKQPIPITPVEQPINLSPQQPAAVTMQAQAVQQPPVKAATATKPQTKTKVTYKQPAVTTKTQPQVSVAQQQPAVTPTAQPQVSVAQQQPVQPVVKATTTPPQQPSVSLTQQQTAPTTSPTVVAQNNKPGYNITDTSISQKAANKYTIQLYSSYNKNDAINFIISNKIQNKAAFYVTNVGGRNKYVVVYGSYVDQNAAMAAINAMPAKVSAWGPTIRLLGEVQQEIASQ